MTTYYEPGLSCPACFQDLSMSLAEANDQGHGPLDGDQTVCGHCTSFLRYKEDWDAEAGTARLSLVVIDRDDFEELPEKHQIELMAVRNKLITIRAQGREHEEAALAAMAREITRIKLQIQAALCSCLYCRSGDGLNCIRGRNA